MRAPRWDAVSPVHELKSDCLPSIFIWGQQLQVGTLLDQRADRFRWMFVTKTSGISYYPQYRWRFLQQLIFGSFHSLFKPLCHHLAMFWLGSKQQLPERFDELPDWPEHFSYSLNEYLYG